MMKITVEQYKTLANGKKVKVKVSPEFQRKIEKLNREIDKALDKKKVSSW